MKKCLTIIPLIALSHFALAQEQPVRLMPDESVWKDNQAFPKGVKIATLVGDPAKAGDVVVLRIKFPADFQMPPHTHPYSEVAPGDELRFVTMLGQKRQCFIEV